MIDNLRRSLTPIAVVLGLFLGWAFLPVRVAAAWTSFIVLIGMFRRCFLRFPALYPDACHLQSQAGSGHLSEILSMLLHLPAQTWCFYGLRAESSSAGR